jgi:hypothetical protein
VTNRYFVEQIDEARVALEEALPNWFRGRQRQNSVSCPARALPWL